MSDARSVLSIAISHNMDNIDPIDQEDLAKYMGLTKDANGATVQTGTAAVADASNSKRMEVGNPATTITYWYRRGGVTLRATINVATQTMQWAVSGVTQGDNRHIALREGLKLAVDGDLTVQQAEIWGTT